MPEARHCSDRRLEPLEEPKLVRVSPVFAVVEELAPGFDSSSASVQGSPERHQGQRRDPYRFAEE